MILASFLTVGLIFALSSPADKTDINEGVLDLASVQLTDYETIDLSGEWAFYWNRFLQDNEGSTQDSADPGQPRPAILVPVPGVWNHVEIDGQSLPGFGYGTYRLTVVGAVPGEKLALRIDSVSTAFSLFLDGQLIAQSGQISQSPAGFVPYNRSQIVEFDVPAAEFDLFVQIANFSYARGGFWTPFEFGRPAAIHTLNNQFIYKDAILIGMLLVLSLYHLTSFFLFRQARTGLYLFVINLAILFRLAVYGDYLLLRIWPDLPFDALIKTNYLTLYWVPVLFYLLVDELLPLPGKSRRWNRMLLAYAAISSIITLFATVKAITVLVLPIDAMVLLITLLGLIRIVQSLVYRSTQAYLMLFLLFPIIGFVIHDILYQTNLITSRFGELTPVGLVVFLLNLSILSAIQSTQVKARQLVLENQLIKAQATETQLNAQITELQHYRQKALDNEQPQARILVVMDAGRATDAMLQHLHDPAYELSWAQNQVELDQFLRQGAMYDLVILDNRLWQMTGFELLNEIRQEYSLIELPILLLTDRANDQEAAAGYQAGANDVLGRPFSQTELLSKVSHLLQLKKMLRRQVQTELSFLQSQIKPHFIFNAISVITSLVTTVPRQAELLLLNLADYLRDSFDFENPSDRSSLKRELHLLDAYLSIEQARFGQRLNIERSIQPGLDRCQLPILCLQPLVENAIRHGLMVRSEGGTVRLVVSAQKQTVQITVADDGIGMTQEKVDALLAASTAQARGIGVRNIHRRLLTTYGRGLTIQSEPGQGTRIDFYVPCPLLEDK